LAEFRREARLAIARHSRSFDLAAKLLPRERRDDVALLYAWCRYCDDAIDLAAPAEQPAALARLEGELRAGYRTAPLEPALLRGLREVVTRHHIPIAYPLELLEGMRMDAHGARYDTLADLLVYCWRVAGSVGLMMCHVLGVSDRAAVAHAAHLGIAMQLTNICRDVAEDWARGRVYLPADLLGPTLASWLQTPRAPAAQSTLPACVRAQLVAPVRQLLAAADRYYASADRGIGFLEPRSALAVRTARLVYAAIGCELSARGYDVGGRAIVPTHRKLMLAAAALARLAGDSLRWRGRRVFAPDEVLRGADAVRLA
jgi:phytoene synthase